ncbi:MAG: hypothetical protein KUL82_13420 [Bdellovibrio sp.]|uniref:hypothetical protein n=1 Tax=Bdellovibrio sp. TaxID=28201 RepID=UPI0039E49FD0|nr:hypothetical protein [Bdellovibrio sp.]
MRPHRSQAGQGIIEALLSLPLLFLAGSILTLLLYRALVFHLTNYHLHEALICTQDASIQFCQKELEGRLSGILITQQRVSIRFQKNQDLTKGTVSIELRPPLKLEKSIRRKLL